MTFDWNKVDEGPDASMEALMQAQRVEAEYPDIFDSVFFEWGTARVVTHWDCGAAVPSDLWCMNEAVVVVALIKSLRRHWIETYRRDAIEHADCRISAGRSNGGRENGGKDGDDA